MIIVLVVAACCLAVVEAVEVSNKVNFMKLAVARHEAKWNEGHK